MNQQKLYQWLGEVTSQLNGLNRWQQDNIALFSYGVASARSCQEWKIASYLSEYGQVASLRRRLQRFLSNQGLRMSEFFREWSGWVVSGYSGKTLWLVVDETKLHDRLAAMVVGLVYERRCIPLAWRCYVANSAAAYPAEGQLEVIRQLLLAIREGLPDERRVVVLADRALGACPALLRMIAELGWYYLCRVTKQSKLITATKQEYTIYNMVQRGQHWQASGLMFKRRGHLPAHARVLWAVEAAEPWALVTNDPTLSGYEYAKRNWQEQAFRDLKSHGWQWQLSQVLLPAHAERLLILLAVAYAWMLALGCLAVQQASSTLPLKTETVAGRAAKRCQFSLFREGLALFNRAILHLRWRFAPDPRFST